MDFGDCTFRILLKRTLRTPSLKDNAKCLVTLAWWRLLLVIIDRYILVIYPESFPWETPLIHWGIWINRCIHAFKDTFSPLVPTLWTSTPSTDPLHRTRTQCFSLLWIFSITHLSSHLSSNCFVKKTGSNRKRMASSISAGTKAGYRTCHYFI